MSLTWYDIVVIGILAFTTLRGAMKGAIWQLAAIGGVALCFTFAETISAFVGPMVPLEEPLNHWVVLFGAYLLFSFLSFSLARMLTEAIERAQFKEYNQHLGAIFGFVKGVAICLVLTFFLVTLSASAREMLKESRSAHYAAIIMDRIHPVMPEKLRNALGEYLKLLDEVRRRDASLDQDPDSTTDDPDLQSEDDPGGFAGREDRDLVEDSLPPSRNTSSRRKTTTTEEDDLDSELVPRSKTSSIPTGKRKEIVPGLSVDVGKLLRNPKIDQLLSKLPAVQGGELESLVRQAINNTDPQDLPELMEKLRSRVPGYVRRVATEWKNGRPGTAKRPDTNQPSSRDSTSTRQKRKRLIRDVSQLLYSDEDRQIEFEQSVEQQLQGVPDGVVLSLLEDWSADLSEDADDPDPATSSRTSLLNRIQRHLQTAGIPRTNLGEEPLDSPLGDPQ